MIQSADIRFMTKNYYLLLKILSSGNIIKKPAVCEGLVSRWLYKFKIFLYYKDVEPVTGLIGTVDYI